jgi:hypothetical protein
MSAIVIAADDASTLVTPLLVNPVLSDTGAAPARRYYIALTADRANIIAADSNATAILNKNNLYNIPENNDGTLGTEVLVGSFPNENILSFYEPITEMGFDGEAFLVTGVTGASSPSKLYKSSGWQNRLTVPPVWTQVTLPDLLYTQQGPFSLNRACFGRNGIMVFSDYRSQTFPPGGGSNATRGGSVYISTDKGVTFTRVLNITTYNSQTNNTNVHIHSAAWDPWDERIYITFGDLSGSSTEVVGQGNMEILYSDDYGLTWSAIPELQFFTPTNTVKSQFTGIFCTREAVVFGSDNNFRGPCVVFPKKGYRKLGKGFFATFMNGTAPFTYDFTRVGGLEENFPIFFGFLRTAAAGAIALNASFNGLDWYECYRLDAPNVLSNNQGSFSPIGPTLAGKVYAEFIGYTANGANTATRLVADLATSL